MNRKVKTWFACVVFTSIFHIQSTGYAWWESLLPFPPGASINSIHGTGTDDIWAVGDCGTIVHFDGVKWTRITSLVDCTLNGVWSHTPNDAWIVGDKGTVLHWNGESWSQQTVNEEADFLCVWGVDTGEIFLGGRFENGGVIYSWNAIEWKYDDLYSPEINSIGGQSPGLIFAVGSDGKIYNYKDDGFYWNWMTPQITSLPLFSVTLINNEAFACGGLDLDGIILHWNGTAWNKLDCGFYPGFRSIWAIDPEHIFAAGSRGVILNWNGVSWSEMESGTSSTIKSLWAVDSTHVFAATEDDENYEINSARILEYDGTQWKLDFPDITENLGDLWADSANNIWLLSSNTTGSKNLFHWNGVHIEPVSTAGSIAPNDVWGADANDVYIVGTGGIILHYDGQTIAPMTSGTTGNLTGVWGSGTTDVYTVGYDSDSGSGIVLHFDGQAWSPVTLNCNVSLADVSGSASDDVCIGGEKMVWYWNGQTWTELPPLPIHDDGGVRSVWSHGQDTIIATAWDESAHDYWDHIFQFNGTGWEQIASFYEETFYLSGCSGGSAIVTSSNGYIYRFEAGLWTIDLSKYCGIIGGIYTLPSGDSYGAGVNGTLFSSNRIPDLSLQIDAPETAGPGDIFYTDVILNNHVQPMQNIPVVVAMEIDGDFWFWPSWTHWNPPGQTEIDYSYVDLDLGQTIIEILPEFHLPDIVRPVEGIFYTAVLTDDCSNLLGPLVYRPFCLK